ncbi:N-acetylmuramoyl-L-alanine amidase [Deinococcus sedimenti]|uniref:MurNAc-LAA domain-containing protein n=1 Tax=Deinococcus sedimenti TaxID=1867090 RepID=A0ABQ2S3F6_9DEIO|nr:N-acetylmuramoyl-L-alanine amidase [Deinococcus sedimenti]GGR84657.1 hypothetical protein GCM10008960_09610 [Deinococcus sedimenti]
MIIVLDPGHGDTPGAPGYDSGACDGNRHEAVAALEAALTLKHILTGMGFTVHLTRDGTAGGKPDLNQRLTRARQLGARAFISVHYDSKFEKPRHRRGCYYAPGTASRLMADALRRRMGRDFWIAPSSSSRFNGLYIDAFPDALPSVMLELDSIQYAPATRDRSGRLALLTPYAKTIAAFLNAKGSVK